MVQIEVSSVYCVTKYYLQSRGQLQDILIWQHNESDIANTLVSNMSAVRPRELSDIDYQHIECLQTLYLFIISRQ